MTYQLRQLLATLVAEASDGELSTADVLAASGPLSAVGVTSLAQIRLIDSIEDRFGIDLDADPSVVNDLDALTGYLVTHGVDG